MDIQATLLNLAGGLAVAVVTSWLTVNFALRRFYSEKWFERRLEAYTRIIESLHLMKRAMDDSWREEERGIELSDDRKKELQDTYQNSLSEIRKAVDMGALLLPPEAIAVLQKLENDLEAASNEQIYIDHLDSCGVAISKCLTDLRPIAKKELRA